MKRLLVAAVAVLAILGLWFVLARGGGRGAGASAPSVEERELPERVVADLRSTPAERSELAPQPAAPSGEPARAAGAPPAVLEPPVRVRGRVLDVAGIGLVGVPLVKRVAWPRGFRGPVLATSGAGGVFELELVLGREAEDLACAPDAPFVTLRAAHVARDNATREHLIVAGPAIELGGTVVRTGGAPLADARVRFDVPIDAFAGFSVPLDSTVATPVETRTGADGRFEHLRVPAIARARLGAEHEGFRAAELAAPLEARADLWIELEPLVAGEPWLRGIVVTAEGAPAKGAEVRLDSLATKTASDGTFGLEKDWAYPEAPLVAALRGFQPAIFPRGGELLQQDFAPAPVRLVLGGPTLRIAGRIVDADGGPCRGWQVGLLDGTVVTPSRVPFDLAEDLARGKKVMTQSDRQGAFVLEGLSPREYVVQAFEQRSLLLVRSDSVPAGTSDLVLRVPEDALHERLAGQVVGHDGRAVVGASVATRLVTASTGGATSWESGHEAVSDETGHFELANVPRRYASISVDGEAVIPQTFEVDETASAGDLRLEVARRCHLRIELAPAGESTAGESAAPDAVSALDAEGQALQLYTFQGTSWSSTTRLQLSRLGTHPLGVSEDAHTLVFYRGEQELRRAEITLVPDEVAVVRIGGP